MIKTKTLILYGYKCETCGYETDLEKGGSDKPLSDNVQDIVHRNNGHDIVQSQL